MLNRTSILPSWWKSKKVEILIIQNRLSIYDTEVFLQISGSSKTIVDTSTNEPIVMVNNRKVRRPNIIKYLGIKLENFSVTFAFRADNVRIKVAKIKSKLSSLETSKNTKIKIKSHT
ncbi:hypothetical protein NPIL_378371 [Nephila pilipes]|uniref:Uncharacterized protein n=1 Tax=Nephila pilipes TaxID=299642 RepID=A0A8X6N7I4_NEPPI|nr:hypothetical protein NPIL_378371 [Nephila pilipes]